MWEKTWESEGLEGCSWRTGKTSLPTLVRCTDMSGKTSSSWGSTSSCTHPATQSGTEMMSSWTYLWHHHICTVRVCKELHESAVSEEAAVFDTHNFSGIVISLHSNSNLEREEQSWRCHTTSYQTTLQGYSNQNSMVLAQKQTQRSIEGNTSPEINPHLYGQLI